MYLLTMVVMMSIVCSCGNGGNKVPTMNEVIDLYNNKDTAKIVQKLEELGYIQSLITEGENNNINEYWTQNVGLKCSIKYNGDFVVEPIKEQGSYVVIRKGSIQIWLNSVEKFKEWEDQLVKMGYKNESYGDGAFEEKGWTMLGVQGNWFKQYVDDKNNRVEFIKISDNCYSVYTIEVN